MTIFQQVTPLFLRLHALWPVTRTPNMKGKTIVILMVKVIALIILMFILFSVGTSGNISCGISIGYFTDDTGRIWDGGTDPGNIFAHYVNVFRADPKLYPFEVFHGLLWIGLAIPVFRTLKGHAWEAGFWLHCCSHY